jgi:hypothetical protein
MVRRERRESVSKQFPAPASGILFFILKVGVKRRLSQRVLPGSLPGLRRGTNGTFNARARGAPKIRPRASKPIDKKCFRTRRGRRRR